ncbi:TRAP transporter permease [Thermodesulfobacteriota bacterium]
MFSWLVARGGDREFLGTAGKFLKAFAVAITIYHLYIFSSGSYEIFPHRTIHVGSILALCMLTYSFSDKNKSKFLTIDFLLSLTSLAIMVYLVTNSERIIYDRVMMEPGSLTRLELFMGGALIIILLEAARRAMGPILGMLTLLFLVYAYIGPHLGGILNHGGYSVSEVIDFTVFSEQGIFGMPVGISSTYIILFLVFAGMVLGSGATDFFRDLALASAGRYKGGPAKVAVIGSAFIGSITGSAAANVAITGSVTIPMMKKAGFESHMAGAIEAAASKGGHILPPVMAGTVFIIAEFIGTTYWSLCGAALIPALLYFLGVFVQVHAYALKHQTKMVQESEIPSIWVTLKRGSQHLLPFIVLVGLLAMGYSPIWSALWSMPVTLAVSWFRKDTRLGIIKLLEGFAFAVRVVRVIMVATALGGIIMGVVLSTGLGSKLMSSVSHLSGGRLEIALVIAAAVSFLLGLSLNMAASYILTAILIVPAAVALGVEPVAAHLFSFYYASLAVITPPVGATFFQAAALAEAPPFKTGWTAARLAVAAFIVPVFFVYHPSLLLVGSVTETLIATAVTAVSIICIALACEGWIFGQLNILQRILLIIAACMLIAIKPGVVIVSFLIIALVVLWNWSGKRTVTSMADS